MKNIYIYMMIVVSCVVMLNSCDIETSDNGKLDGFWYAERIDSISGRESEAYKDCYWAFQYKLLSIRRSSTQEEYFFRFNRKGDTLVVSQPYKLVVQGTDSLLPDNRELLPLGIQSTEEKFQLLQLTNKRMQLQSQTLRFTFRKL